VPGHFGTHEIGDYLYVLGRYFFADVLDHYSGYCKSSIADITPLPHRNLGPVRTQSFPAT
jgi:hypothetical protein